MSGISQASVGKVLIRRVDISKTFRGQVLAESKQIKKNLYIDRYDEESIRIHAFFVCSYRSFFDVHVL